MGYVSVIGPIVQKIRDSSPDLAGRAWGFQRPKAQTTAPTLPYVVVISLAEVSVYHSKTRHHTTEEVQVSLFATSAGQAGVLWGAIDGALTYGSLTLAETAFCVRIYLKSLRRLPIEQGVTLEGGDIHHWAGTYTVVVDRATPHGVPLGGGTFTSEYFAKDYFAGTYFP